MKRAAKITLLLVLCIALCPPLYSQRAKIEFKEEIVDLGEMQEGETVEHLFTFTNPGDIPLQIFDLQPS